MYKFIPFFLGTLMILFAIEALGRKQPQVEINVEHWEIDGRLLHTITLKCDDLSKLANKLKEYDPYIYKNKIELRFETESINDFKDKYYEIKNHIKYGNLNRK